jgi:AraC-like DNA-binding protein
MAAARPIRLDLRGISIAEQLAFWQEVSPAYRVGRAGHVALDVSATIWPLSEMLVSRFAARAHRVVRDVQADSPGSFVKLRLYRRGGGRLQYDGGAAQLGAGAVALIDHSRSWSAAYTDHDQCSIFIPHALLGYRPDEHPAVRLFPEATASGALLRWAMQSVMDCLEPRTPEDREAALLRTCCLLEAILCGGAGKSRSPDIERIRAEAMQSFVRNRIAGPAPRASEIAHRFGVSRATVFRVFADHGGVRAFLMARRLDAARHALMTTPPRRGRVVRLADALGFASTAHFSDAFLDRFGERPSAVASCVPASQPEAGNPGMSLRSLHAARAEAANVYGRMTG